MGRGGSDWISRCMLLLESPVLNGDFVESLLEEDLLHFKRVDTDINKVDSLWFDENVKNENLSK